MPFCTSCGAELQPDAVFCSKCGTKKDQPIQPIPASNSPTTSTSTSTTPTPIFTSTPASPTTETILSQPAFWGGLLVVVGFLITWVKDYDGKYNALDLLIGSVKTIKYGGEIKYFFIIVPIALGALAITGLLSFISSFSTGFVKNSDYNDFKNVPIGCFVVIAILVYIVVKKWGRMVGVDPDWKYVFENLHTGFYVCLGGAAILAFSDKKT